MMTGFQHNGLLPVTTNTDIPALEKQKVHLTSLARTGEFFHNDPLKCLYILGKKPLTVHSVLFPWKISHDHPSNAQRVVCLGIKD